MCSNPHNLLFAEKRPSQIVEVLTTFPSHNRYFASTSGISIKLLTSIPSRNISMIETIFKYALLTPIFSLVDLSAAIITAEL